jgi:NAD(P)H-nitrite reductase large subunit
MSKERQNIVILGAGAFGVATAREIAPKLDTTRYRLIVINPRPYYVHLPGFIRTSVTAEGKLEEQVLIEYGNFLNGKGELKIAKVASFTSTKEGGEVVLSSGEKVPYSVLVVAPGSLWEGPLGLPDEPEEVTQHINEWRAKIERADSILLAGGGSVGIGEYTPTPVTTLYLALPPEFAGEIKDFFPVR